MMTIKIYMYQNLYLYRSMYMYTCIHVHKHMNREIEKERGREREKDQITIYLCVHDGLSNSVLLPLLPKCWDISHEPLFLATTCVFFF